jgi:hypothetical protein
LRDDWVTIEQAMDRLHKSRSTIYLWVRQGRVQTMRPLRMLWLHMPDLLNAEAATRKGRPAEAEARPLRDCSYLAAHKRVERAKGSAKRNACEFCGGNAHHWSYKGNSPREIRGQHSPQKPVEITWSPDPDDYQALCTSCHRVFDGLLRLERGAVVKMLQIFLLGTGENSAIPT